MVWLNSYKPLTKRNLQYDSSVIPKFHSGEVKDLLQASYKRNGDAESIGKKYNLKLDHSLSNAEHKVFIDKDGNPDVVFTGTRKFGDYLTDAALTFGLGGLTPRFQNSTKLIDKVKAKYKNKPLSVPFLQFFVDPSLFLQSTLSNQKTALEILPFKNNSFISDGHNIFEYWI
jgi:hypothetical protein